MSASEIQEKLENELYGKETGYVTFVELVPGGTKNGLGYGPCGYDVCVLDADGRSVAFRYTDDSINDDWQIGPIVDAAEAAAATAKELEF